jgi:crotonobetainyl-CoA:carnitine CoA-transferase CaiB-like acyl-CoA transferase
LCEIHQFSATTSKLHLRKRFEQDRKIAVQLLNGVKILDLSRVLAGPYATMVLADLGADVIKVEHPDRGDDTRHWGPPFACGQSAYFLSINRNKRSITADLKNKEDLERIKQFACKADVLIENFRRGTLSRLGMDYSSVKLLNPALVYCSITGFGPGKEENQPGYDFLVQARAGLMAITGHPGGEPTKVGVAVADIACGLYAANAILAALYRRESHTENSSCLSCSLKSANARLLSGSKPFASQVYRVARSTS